jgi:hypothetical protein
MGFNPNIGSAKQTSTISVVTPVPYTLGTVGEPKFSMSLSVVEQEPASSLLVPLNRMDLVVVFPNQFDVAGILNRLRCV